MRFYVVCIFMVMLVTLWQADLWTGQKSMQSVSALRKDVVEQEAKNAALSTRNARLYKEIKRLKQNDDVIEEKARTDLGMIKAGEKYYQVAKRQAQSLPVMQEEDAEVHAYTENLTPQLEVLESE